MSIKNPTQYHLTHQLTKPKNSLTFSVNSLFSLSLFNCWPSLVLQQSPLHNHGNATTPTTTHNPQPMANPQSQQPPINTVNHNPNSHAQTHKNSQTKTTNKSNERLDPIGEPNVTTAKPTLNFFFPFFFFFFFFFSSSIFFFFLIFMFACLIVRWVEFKAGKEALAKKKKKVQKESASGSDRQRSRSGDSVKWASPED
jgi:hypothetical protein